MSIRESVDGTGRPRFQAYVYDATVRKRVYVGTYDTRKAAEEASWEYRIRVRMGERPKEPKNITFDELAKRWLAELHTVRPATREDYRKALRRVSPLLGSKMLRAINRRDIDELVSSLSAQYSACTVRKTLIIVKTMLRRAIDWDLLDRLPTGGSRLNLPRIPKRKYDPLTQDQVSRLLEAAPEYWRPFYLLLLTSGLRRAEAFGLTTRDLDLEGGFLRVRQQLVKGRLVPLKSDASDRRVPLPAQTVRAMGTHIERRPENDLDLVFPSPNGKPADPSNFYARVWIPTREAAGLPRLRVHDCRHHVASLMISSGLSIKYVQSVMGHATVAVLLDVYSHLLPGEETAAVVQMEEWLNASAVKGVVPPESVIVPPTS